MFRKTSIIKNEKRFWKCNSEVVYLECPYREKDTCLALGCKWDNFKQKWYTTRNNPNFNKIWERWGNRIEKIYLYFPYSRRDELKCAGACWDRDKKKWYVEENHPNLAAILKISKIIMVK